MRKASAIHALSTNRVFDSLKSIAPIMSIILSVIYGIIFIEDKVALVEKRLSLIEAANTNVANDIDEDKKSILRLEEKIDKVLFMMGTK